MPDDDTCSDGDIQGMLGTKLWNLQTTIRGIDYFLVSDGMRDSIVSTEIHNEIYGSDHCPVELVLK